MTGTLPKDLKIHWPHHVSTLTHAYNCTSPQGLVLTF